MTRFRDIREQSKAADVTLQQELTAGARWKLRADPDDGRFALIELRVPYDRITVQDELVGQEAVNKIVGFCKGILQAAGLIRPQPIMRRR